ncbi:hypothetical protein [Paenibacillus sp. NPDC093718]|uniref:hypothetical protein n=1 Tax=Paenibacillus sp. NPDC093718 TaxID=3390601 RepID=UPI003CFFF3C9
MFLYRLELGDVLFSCESGLDNITYVNEGGTMKYKEGLDRQKVAEQHGFDWWLSQSAEFMKSDAGYLKKR